MKSVLLFIFFFLAINVSQSVHAQIRRTSFGVKAGVNRASFSENSGERSGSSRWGFQGGVFMKHEFSKFIGLQPELYYSLQGQKTEYPGEENTKVTLHYLNAPILISFNLKNSLAFQFGPQFGFLLSGNEPIESIFKMKESDFNKFDFSICGGVVINVSKHVQLGARLNYGLTDINYVYPFITFYGPGYVSDKPKNDYNRVLQFSLGYSF